MARLIVKSPYIKCGGGQSAGGYMKYIATRERVEIIPDDRPPTRKQEQLITKLVKDFPDTKDLLEYFRATDFSELEEEIENTRQEVRNYLNQAQRQTLMHLIDAQEQLKTELAQASFEAGFRLAMGLLRELEDKRIRLQLEEEG